MQPFTAKAIEIMKNIPPGNVMTYGQVAAHAGSPRSARQIARLLHSMSRKHDLPWHRIVNAQGRIALQDENARFTQISLLRMEGIAVSEQGELDIELYRYNPI